MPANGKTAGRARFGQWHVLIVVLVVIALAVAYGNYLASVGSYNPNANATTSLVSTTTAMPQNASNVAVNLTEEMNNSANYGFVVNAEMFRTPYASNCTRELIDSCDNNAPQQFICVNSAYASNIAAQYQSIYSSHANVCPQYVLAGTVGCTSYADYCVVTQQK